MDIFEEVGHNIRSLRKAVDPPISINRLATAAEIDPGQLSRAERGLAGLSLPAMARIAETLGVSLVQLIDRQVETSESEQSYLYTRKKDRTSLISELAEYVLNRMFTERPDLTVGKSQKELFIQQFEASIEEGVIRGQIKVESELTKLKDDTAG